MLAGINEAVNCLDIGLWSFEWVQFLWKECSAFVFLLSNCVAVYVMKCTTFRYCEHGLVVVFSTHAAESRLKMVHAGPDCNFSCPFSLCASSLSRMAADREQPLDERKKREGKEEMRRNAWTVNELLTADGSCATLSFFSILMEEEQSFLRNLFPWAWPACLWSSFCALTYCWSPQISPSPSICPATHGMWPDWQQDALQKKIRWKASKLVLVQQIRKVWVKIKHSASFNYTN